MGETMAERLRAAAERLRAQGGEFERAVADLLDEELLELEHGDPHYLHSAALRVADAIDHPLVPGEGG